MDTNQILAVNQTDIVMVKELTKDQIVSEIAEKLIQQEHKQLVKAID